MRDCKRVIEDIYRLMSYVLNEWLGMRLFASMPPPRRRRSTRPPRASSLS
jgi:hypothetical protein